MSRARWWAAALGSALFMTVGGADPASAQDPASATFQVGGDTVTAQPRMSYPAGWFHRKLLGTNNRALWDLSFSAPLLDLDLFAGGLTVTERGGGQQTASLGFLGADGQEGGEGVSTDIGQWDL